MNWPLVMETLKNSENSFLIKIRTKKGPISLEKFIRKKFSKMGEFYLLNHWSPYSKIGVIEIMFGNRKIFIEWIANKEKDEIIDVKEIDNFDIEGFEEYLSSLGVESSVLRLMRWEL